MLKLGRRTGKGVENQDIKSGRKGVEKKNDRTTEAMVIDESCYGQRKCTSGGWKNRCKRHGRAQNQGSKTMTRKNKK